LINLNTPDNFMLYSKVTGNGPLLIFIHGNSQSHVVWDGLTGDDALSGYTSIAVDMPGHGRSFRSTQPGQDYTLRAMAHHLVNFANQYSSQGYILVASSLATNYVAEAAHLFNNCKGVFLMGACVIGENVMPDEIIQPNPNFPPTFSATATDHELDALIDDEAYHVSPQLKEQLKAMYRDTDPQLRAILGTSIAGQNYIDEIGNLWKQNLPIAAVYGADDKLISTDYLQKLPLKFWKNKVIKIPKAGHCCQFDEPALIAGLIADFAADCFK
jgi:pimeloyl-ACP methyl ester carboxylesterase